MRGLVARVRNALRELFSLPDDYAVALGNGGASAFWEVAAFGLVAERSLHLVNGEFSSKFAEVIRAAPFLSDPIVVEADAGGAPVPVGSPEADVLAWAHNETSTGVMIDVAARPTPARRWWWSTAPLVRAACHWTPPPWMPTTSRRRRASAPTAGCGSRC